MSTIKNSPAEEIATMISNAMNTQSGSINAIAELLCNDHRYLQQEFWKLIEAVIKKHAQHHDEKRYDDRNEYTVKMCAKIAPLLEKLQKEIYD